MPAKPVYSIQSPEIKNLLALHGVTVRSAAGEWWAAFPNGQTFWVPGEWPLEKWIQALNAWA